MVNLTAKNPRTAEKEKNLPGSERMERGVLQKAAKAAEGTKMARVEVPELEC